MVFCYQNCSDLLWEKIVLVIEKNFAKLSRSLEQFLVTECFLTCSWRFLISNELEKLQLEKIIGVQKHAGKVRKKIDKRKENECEVRWVSQEMSCTCTLNSKYLELCSQYNVPTLLKLEDYTARSLRYIRGLYRVFKLDMRENNNL